MAVENLAIISSPLSGLAMAMNSGMGSIQGWMVEHGIRPSHVLLGAVFGAIIQRQILDGAIRGALVVGGFELVLYYLMRHVGSP